MTREEIIMEVSRGQNLPFFRQKWADFCRRVEDYAEDFYRLASEADDQYKRESADKDRKAWVEGQVAEAEARLKRVETKCRQTVKTFDQAVGQHNRALDQFGESVRRIRPEWNGQPPVEQLLDGPLPADLRSLTDLQERIVADHRKAEELRDAYLSKYREARELAKLAEPGNYSPQLQAEWEKRGPEWEWAHPFEQKWRTAYVWRPGQDRMRDFEPTGPRLAHSFWVPATLFNPVAWFDVVPGGPVPELSPHDRILHDAVILAIAHDKSPHMLKTSPQIIPPGEYSGYFMMHGFVEHLWNALKDRDDTPVRLAWCGIEGRLPELEPAPKETPTGPKPQTKGGRKPVHDAEFWRRVRETYEEYFAKDIGSKGAWNEAARVHGIKSGPAARVQCGRYLDARRKKAQN